MELFDISDIVNKLAIERITNEKQYINELINNNDFQRNDLINKIEFLDNILSELNPDKIDISEQIKYHQFNKPWNKLIEPNKIIKVIEFCKNHDINKNIQNQLINAVKNKLLNTKKQVIYDENDAIIISIIFEKQIYK